ncbi:TonB-dependent receptor [Actomonas aquatica]|uniref:TonB-dependent receptor n=1 Tax=Actomonas aquatica TaxID=2866162 RepID=A0ABZ1C9R1_9BACT|nr:TonB-dependent receptor [Opitutus sp. WL0086]WRQ87324.1 TonB-dependent receptor [Opitutus sp. WL0086]
MSARGWVAAGALMWLGAIGLRAQPQPQPELAVPAGPVETALRELTEATGVQLIYQVEDLQALTSPGVRGALTTADALAVLLQGTGLEAVQDRQSGAFVIRRRVARERDVARSKQARRAAVDREAAGARTAGLEVFELSPFEVRDRSDVGYRVSNTISATRMAVAGEALPMAVNLYNEEFIADQHPYDLYDVVRWAPGVHQDNVSPQGWARYNMRGYTRAAVQRNGFVAYRFIDTSNVERVEVVKGPASLLYGQINPGGVINYITKRPDVVAAASLDLSIGSDHFSRAVLDLTQPLSEGIGPMYGRVVLMTEDVPRFQVLSSGRKYLVAPSLTWQWGNRGHLTLSYEHFERADDMPTSGVVMRYENRIPTVPYGPLPRDFSYAGEGDYQDFISDALMAELEWRLTDQVSVQAAYLDSSWDMEWRASGQGGTGLLYQSVIDAFYPPEVGLTAADAMYRRNRWEHQWGGERSGRIDLAGDFTLGSVDVRLLLGTKRTFSTHYRGQQANNPTDPTSPLYLKPWDLRDPSTWDREVPFGVEALNLVADTRNGGSGASWHMMGLATFNQDRTRVLGGLSRHELENNPSYNLINGSVSAGSVRAANVPQIGVTHELTEGITAFASASKSFLANGSLLLVENVPSIPARASVGRGSEAGVKLDLWGGRLSGTVSVYRIRANPTDVVRVNTGTAEDGTTLFSDLQGGSQRSQGAEIDLLYSPVEGWQLMFSASWCDAIYEEHPRNPAFNGATLVATPDQTLSLWTKYEPRQGPLRNWLLAGGVNHVGSYSHVALNPFERMPAYTTADLTVGRKLKVWGRPIAASLAVKNVTNERYYASASSWGFPRQWIFSLRTEF